MCLGASSSIPQQACSSSLERGRRPGASAAVGTARLHRMTRQLLSPWQIKTVYKESRWSGGKKKKRKIWFRQYLSFCPHIISVLQCLQFQTNEVVCHCLGPGASGIAVWNAKECFSSLTNNGFLTNTCAPRTWIICSKAGASSGAQSNNSPFWIMTLSLTLMLPRGSYGRWVSKEMPAWRKNNRRPPLSCWHLYQ